MHLKLKPFVPFITVCVLVVAAAYIQWGILGLPYLRPFVKPNLPLPSGVVHGFPAWLRITHYVNFLFLSLLVRSGLSILADHPRLYGNADCTPGSEWLRLTPIIVPKDRVWTAKDDSRYLSPWIGLPGRRHTIGMARHWHFLSVLFWVLNGVFFVVMLFVTNQWQRLVPTSWNIVPEAWAVFVHYVTFHLPVEPDGFYTYNALQQLAYFAVVFILAPLAIVTGPSMSPALTSRFKWYPQLPGNRQIGRSLHFLVMCSFVAFFVIHVGLVAYTSFIPNMNHIVMGTDNANPIGLYIGLFAIGVVVLLNALAYWAAWKHPRTVQHVSKALVGPIMGGLLDHPAPVTEFTRADISPYFWPNGKMPTSDDWTSLASDGFANYRLKVYGLVDNPVELSLADLRAMGKKDQITLHHCIQGWSGIAEWGGVPLSVVIDLARPKPGAKSVVFYSFGDGVEFTTGETLGVYYDSLSLKNAHDPLTLLAYEMNYEPLSELHGAPLRLRVENQLGFKMVKWIRAIEFVADIKSVNLGEGGFAEDHEYFGELANI